MGFKKCGKCKEMLLKTNFHKNTSYCKICTKIHNKKRNELRKKRLRDWSW